MGILIAIIQYWCICSIEWTVVMRGWKFWEDVSLFMSIHTNSPRSTPVLGWTVPIGECCPQNKGICYRNVNFRLTRSLDIYWHIFRSDWLRSGGANLDFREFDVFLAVIGPTNDGFYPRATIPCAGRGKQQIWLEGLLEGPTLWLL